MTSKKSSKISEGGSERRGSSWCSALSFLPQTISTNEHIIDDHRTAAPQPPSALGRHLWGSLAVAPLFYTLSGYEFGCVFAKNNLITHSTLSKKADSCFGGAVGAVEVSTIDPHRGLPFHPLRLSAIHAAIGGAAGEATQARVSSGMHPWCVAKNNAEDGSMQLAIISTGPMAPAGGAQCRAHRPGQEGVCYDMDEYTKPSELPPIPARRQAHAAGVLCPSV